MIGVPYRIGRCALLVRVLHTRSHYLMSIDIAEGELEEAWEAIQLDPRVIAIDLVETSDWRGE